MTALREPDGLLLRSTALHHGVDPDAIMKALRTGRLHRVQRGIYICRQDELSPLARARAAVLASGVADAVASHTTAARVHGIPIPNGAHPEHVTVSRNHRRTNRKELRFHARTFDLGEVMLVHGVPVAVPARTLVDLTAVVPRLNAVWAVDDALRSGLTTGDALYQCLNARPGAPGDAAARRIIDVADGKSESILETAGRLTLADAGLPLPIPQYAVHDSDGFVAYLDGGYPELRIGLEYDGQGVHSEPEALYRDRERQNRLHALGWKLLRCTWWDVTYGRERFLASVRRALHRAA